MYCSDFVEDDWTAEFLSDYPEVGPLQSETSHHSRRSDSETDAEFEVEPGSLPESITMREPAMMLPIFVESTNQTARTESLTLRSPDKEARIFAMEQALLQERGAPTQESENSHIDVIDIYSEDFDEDKKLLHELGFVIDPDSLSIFSASADGDKRKADSYASELLESSDKLESISFDILERIHNMQRELDNNPFLSAASVSDADPLEMTLHSIKMKKRAWIVSQEVSYLKL